MIFTFSLSINFASLYSLHRCLCWDYKDALIYVCVILSKVCDQWKKQMRLKPTRITSTIYHYDNIPICLSIARHKTIEIHGRHSILRHDRIQFSYKEIWTTTFLDCMPRYMVLYTWHARVVQSSWRLTWSIIIHGCSIFPPTCIHSRSTPLPKDLLT